MEKGVERFQIVPFCWYNDEIKEASKFSGNQKVG